MTDDAGRFDFLGHKGPVAQLIREYDWSSTPLGPVESWAQCLKTATSLLLQSPVPIVMLWHEEGVMIYNDAYSVFAGHRHPAILGSNVREAWPEVAAFNDHIMKVCLAGGTLAYRDQELTLNRKGAPERVWMNLDYSPVPDENGKPAGVIAIVVETTERVLAEARNREEFQRLQSLFAQAPTFMAMLSGPDHRLALMNPEYRRLVGGRAVLGLPVATALPEMTGQGYIELLDQVFQTGEVIKRNSERIFLQSAETGELEECFLDFVYQPIRDENDAVTHIFVQGSDVTERVRAETHQRRLINELNHRVKNTMSSVQSIVSQSLRGASSPAEASKAITSRILALSGAHNVLTDENWDGADLRTMIESAVRGHALPDGAAFHLEGPAVRVGPRAAMAAALGIHELATNALRYGALSVPGGTVSIHWDMTPDGQFKLEWAESGGPKVQPQSHRGFGLRLILQVLPQELQGQAELEYLPDGVVFTLASSVEAINDKPVYTRPPAVEGTDGTHPYR